ncbi:MAG: polysaccharide deacetylase family protein [Myxococcota bacterium]
MVARHLKPLARDAIGHALRATGMTKPDRRLYYAVTFHRVLPTSALDRYPLGPLAVTPEAFGWFVQLFGRHFTAGTLGDTFERYKSGERPERPFLAITFDDGQLDNFEYAKPVLEREGLRASFFVPVEAIEGNEVLWHDRLAFAADAHLNANPNAARADFEKLGVPPATNGVEAVRAAVERVKLLSPEERMAWVTRIEKTVGYSTRPEWDGMMSWAQLRTLVENGHEVGSHSMSHQIMTQLDRTGLEYETKASREIIEERLQSPVRSFCYPNGDCNGAVLTAVAAAGYTQAVTTRWGPNANAHHPLTLTRCDVQTQHAKSARGQLSSTRMMWRLSRYFPDPS